MCRLLFKHESVGKAAIVHVHALVRPRAAGLIRPSRALVQEHAAGVLWKPLTANSRLVARLVHGGCAVGVAWGLARLMVALGWLSVAIPCTSPTTPPVSSTRSACLPLY